MTENNAAQLGLTDAIAVLKGLRSSLASHRANGPSRLCTDSKALSDADDEVLRALKILVPLSKLRAEDVQAGEPTTDAHTAFATWWNGQDEGSIRFDLEQYPQDLKATFNNLWNEAWRAALASAPVAEPYDSEKRCRAYYDSDLRPFAADGLTYNVWQAVWHAAQFDRAMTPDSSKPRQHSAPVAGEALFWYRPCSDGGYEGPIHNDRIEDVRKRSGAWVPLHAAPQASEAVRNAAYENAAALVGGHTWAGADTGVSDLIARHIRALKTQADKDGEKESPPSSWEADWAKFIAWHKLQFGVFDPTNPEHNGHRISWQAGVRSKERQ